MSIWLAIPVLALVLTLWWWTPKSGKGLLVYFAGVLTLVLLWLIYRGISH